MEKTNSNKSATSTNDFCEFIDALSSEERSVLKSNLSVKVPSFFNSNNHLKTGNDSTISEFKYLAKLLHRISPNHDKIPPNGIIYRGFPEWLDESLLSKLQKEALKRRDKPLDRTDHFLGCGGEYADTLSISDELIHFVSKYAGLIKPTGIASYLYYDEEGLGIKPHVDTDVFSINLMVMLKHDFDAIEESSATLIFPSNGKNESHRLKIGEVMIMYGGNVVHARSIIKSNETVHLLTIGFNPQ